MSKSIQCKIAEVSILQVLSNFSVYYGSHSSLLLIVVNLLLANLSIKLEFRYACIGVHIVYIRFSIVYGFRHPWTVLECIQVVQITGEGVAGMSCTFTSMDS